MRKIKPKSYEYIENLIGAESEVKQSARQEAQNLGLDQISLSSVEASILNFFVDQSVAQKIVEIGTLTGLSALYLLENSKSESKLWTLEKSPEHATAAARVLSHYIQNGQCEIVVGDAREKLETISDSGPFDLVFIDGNKAAYFDYFQWALKNVKAGGVIAVDNVFLAGAVWGDQTQQKFNDKQVGAVQKLNQQAFQSKNLKSILIPTEEGLLICKKLS